MATSAERGPGRATKKGKGTGRVTVVGKPGTEHAINAPVNERYTPPVSKAVKQSPKWMGYLIIALFLLGVVTIMLSYTGFLPGSINAVWLLVGILLLLAGLIVATRYH